MRQNLVVSVNHCAAAGVGARGAKYATAINFLNESQRDKKFGSEKTCEINKRSSDVF